jgi:UDP-2,3-diacylglucosamine hydrolase
VVKAMETHKVTRLIHGHTHRPAVHQLRVNGQDAQRIVLGDWYDQGSILKVDQAQAQLLTQSFNTP